MPVAAGILQFALWAWFLGCVTTYRVRGRILVEGMGIKSAEFAALCLYTCGLAAYYGFHAAGRWILFAILLLWFAVQFLCHWRYTLFGASREKLDGYNRCFQNTLRILPASGTRLVPDLYHIVLHVLILLNLAACLV